MAGWAYWEMGNPEEKNQAAPDENCHSETAKKGKSTPFAVSVAFGLLPRDPIGLLYHHRIVWTA